MFWKGPNAIVGVKVDATSSVDPVTGEELIGVEFSNGNKIYFPASTIQESVIGHLPKGTTKLSDILGESE